MKRGRSQTRLSVGGAGPGAGSLDELVLRSPRNKLTRTPSRTQELLLPAPEGKHAGDTVPFFTVSPGSAAPKEVPPWTLFTRAVPAWPSTRRPSLPAFPASA